MQQGNYSDDRKLPEKTFGKWPGFENLPLTELCALNFSIVTPEHTMYWQFGENSCNIFNATSRSWTTDPPISVFQSVIGVISLLRQHLVFLFSRLPQSAERSPRLATSATRVSGGFTWWREFARRASTSTGSVSAARPAAARCVRGDTPSIPNVVCTAVRIPEMVSGLKSWLLPLVAEPEMIPRGSPGEMLSPIGDGNV